MVYCTHCDKEVNIGDKSCKWCGFRFGLPGNRKTISKFIISFEVTSPAIPEFTIRLHTDVAVPDSLMHNTSLKKHNEIASERIEKIVMPFLNHNINEFNAMFFKTRKLLFQLDYFVTINETSNPKYHVNGIYEIDKTTVHEKTEEYFPGLMGIINETYAIGLEQINAWFLSDIKRLNK